SVDTSGHFTAGTAIGVYANAVVATVGAISGKASVTIAADALHHLDLTPKLVTLKASATTVFSVKGFDASNNPVSIHPTWKVVAGGGTINDQGVFAAGTTAGSYTGTVQVSASGLSATATVVVEAGPLNVIIIDPLSARLKAGETQQFTAAGKDTWGNSVVLDKPTWKAETAAGSVDAKGFFTAGNAEGDWPTGVTVEQDGVRAIASIHVAGGTTLPETPVADGGCSCGVDADASGGTSLTLAFLLMLVLWRRRS
ncbi:MAG: hypothetical protein KAI47_09355, partial [Deltaproteobacteria bacterium]|nr:hypothetical protein [Deltaproteobacteria bacterium]